MRRHFSQESSSHLKPVDLHVARRLGIARTAARMSMEVLGEKVGVRFQQIQKYEAGKNRISASRLFDIAKALGVSVDYFFEGLSVPERMDHEAARLMTALELFLSETTPMDRYGQIDRTGDEFVRFMAFLQSLPESQRRALLSTTHVLAGREECAPPPQHVPPAPEGTL